MTVAAMWEARAADGRGAELAAWARESALPALRGAAGLERLELLTAPGTGAPPAEGGGRVLLIAWWSGEPVPVADPPAELLGRPVHRWSFTSEHVE
ncbi:hypothetical protein [Streptomyces sp. CBMA123]|uniref:hypothetical protein n=1 Tax=Streptomyces sp. CBMA123 TaxID=1896313 RepID=UPI001661C559|nr:hypothetical protein [Streptomyces sp. CBMA123]MBD0692818.1 hypothetical protein [Streptomyces sp. CBMA123]